MNHRRLRLPAAIALLALAAPVLAAGQTGDSHASVVTDLQRNARQLRDSVHDNSVQFGHEVARNVHETQRQFSADMHQAGTSLRQWWNSARDQTRDVVSRI